MLFILHFQGPRLYETTIQLGAKCKTETILIGPLNFLMEMRTKIQIIGKKLFPSLSLSCIHRLHSSTEIGLTPTLVPKSN